jgi:hypothetical protein
MKTTATMEAVSSSPEDNELWSQQWRRNTTCAGQKPRADWKNDLQTYEESRKSPKPPTPFVGIKPYGKCQVVRKTNVTLLLVVVVAGFSSFLGTACKKSASSVPDATALESVIDNSGPPPSAEEVKQQRLSWNLKTLVGSYELAGYTNSNWDASAKLALTEFARIRAQAADTNEPWQIIMSTNCSSAVSAGCNDPMIAYLYAKFSLDQTNSRETFADAFGNAALAIQQSSYPSIRKFYANFRAAQQIHYAWGTSHVAEENNFWNLAITNLHTALQDSNIPASEIGDACNEAADNLLLNTNTRSAFFHQVEVPLFRDWTNTYVCWLLQGQYFIDCAWAKRGGGYANTVTDEGWKSFANYLDEADICLGHAWELNQSDPRIPVKMITVVLGKEQSRDKMEKWFNRAMQIDPNYYDACSAKLYYLEPKWYGSKEDMLEFGRECVTNHTWGGHIPLILLDAHKSIQRQYVDDSEKSNYWKQPEVWSDLKSAFDRFFELNPDATGWYHDYAWYAYQAEQWDTLNRIIPKLGQINYSFFGGTNEFNKMIQLAREHASN